MTANEELQALLGQLKHDDHGLTEGDEQLWANVLDSKLDFLCDLLIIQLQMSAAASMSFRGSEKVKNIIKKHRGKTQEEINHAVKQYINRRDHGKK